MDYISAGVPLSVYNVDDDETMGCRHFPIIPN